MIKWKRFGWTVKDEQKRKLFKNVELRKNILKSCLHAASYRKFTYKFYFNFLFNRYSKTMAISSYKRYCMFTYSGRVIFRHFKLSRHFSKHMASIGYLTGLRKSSF